MTMVGAWVPVDVAPEEGSRCLVWMPQTKYGEARTLIAEYRDGRWVASGSLNTYLTQPTHWCEVLAPEEDSRTKLPVSD